MPGDGDINFCIRKVGTDWWAEIKVNLKFHSGLIAYNNCSGVSYIQHTVSWMELGGCNLAQMEISGSAKMVPIIVEICSSTGLYFTRNMFMQV